MVYVGFLNLFRKAGFIVKSISIMTVISMTFLPSAAIIGSASAALYMGAPLDPIVLVTAWAIVFGIYGLNCFTDEEDMINNPDKRMLFKSNLILLHLVVVVLLISVLVLLFTKRFTIVHFLILLTGIGYSIRILPFFSENYHLTFKRLKEIPFLKSITVALIWGNAFFTINLSLYPQLQTNKLEIILFIVSFTVVTFVNTNFLDMVDIIGDNVAGIPTIPVKYGINNTIIYAIIVPSVLWLIVILWCYLSSLVSGRTTIFLLVNGLFPIIYIGGYYSKLIPQKMIGFAADSCAFVFSLGLFILYCIREKLFI